MRSLKSFKKDIKKKEMKFNPFKKAPEFNVAEHTFHYSFNSIFDSSFEDLLKTCDYVRTYTKTIIIMFIKNDVHICEFKTNAYLEKFLLYAHKSNNVNKGYSRIKEEYRSSLTIDNVLDNINDIGIDNISKDELVFLIKNSKSK